MRRRVLLCLTLISLSACNGDRIGQPIPSSLPSSDISDASHESAVMTSNPDFFFLPPMLKDASRSPQWDAGAFNASLRPRVDICASTSTTAAVFPLPCAPMATLAASVDAGAEQYHANWKVPVDGTVFYRIVVRVGTTVLGFADVQTAANMAALRNVATDEYVPLVDGRTLPIKFRIERHALCAVPGQATCESGTIDLAAGGEVSTALTESGLESGIIFAPVPGALPDEHTVTVQRCGDFHVREVTDLPTYGPCLRVVIQPALSAPLTAPALVYSCDVSEVAVAAGVVDANQAERITLHRLLASGKVEALPHAHGHCEAPVASAGSLGDVVASLAHGQVRPVAARLASMLAPRPLYAARFIDQGGGGFTDLGDIISFPSRSPTTGARLSVAAVIPSATINEFQFALPAKFTELAPVAWSATPTSLTVSVTDLAGRPVRNARVRFAAAFGAVSPAVVDSIGANGLATAVWTMPTQRTPDSVTVSGRGIAGTDFNGPRPGIDPFQPLQAHWGDASSATAPVTVLTGSIRVRATVANGGPVLYAVNTGNDGLSVIDPATGASTFVGPLSSDPFEFTTPGAMATDPATGTIYVWNNSGGTPNAPGSSEGVLLRVNACTGLATRISTAPQSFVVGAALAVSPTTGNMYLLNGSLWSVNKATGVATEIGPLVTSPTGAGIVVFGADFDASGVLYAIDREGTKLYTIDLATGGATPAATLGTPVGITGSIAFDGAGTLVGSSIDTNTLFDVDKATGAVSNVRSVTGNGGTPQGMDFAPACATTP